MRLRTRPHRSATIPLSSRAEAYEASDSLADRSPWAHLGPGGERLYDWAVHLRPGQAESARWARRLSSGVEQLTRNEQVRGSNPRGGSIVKSRDIVNRCPGTSYVWGGFGRLVVGCLWVGRVVVRVVGSRGWGRGSGLG